MMYKPFRASVGVEDTPESPAWSIEEFRYLFDDREDDVLAFDRVRWNTPPVNLQKWLDLSA